MVRVIDVHNHLFPQEWMDYLEKRTQSPRMVKRGSDRVFYSFEASCAVIVYPGHYDPEARIKDLDKCGIDTQILSLTLPSVDELPVEEGVKWARKINDYFAEVCHKYPGRFYAFATLPLQDVGEAVKEMDRSYRELGVKGVKMFSNVNFKPISSPEFYPVYAKAEELGLPVFIHPGVAYTDELMKKHSLPAGLYGFTLDTTIAVMSLIWTGVLERYPRLNFIHAHLGGMVPYLVKRMEDCWQTASTLVGSAFKLPHKPSEYYQRQVYPDTMSGHLPAMRCCLDFVGPKHICLGTDYAHVIGDWEQAIACVKGLGLSREDTEDILRGNAARICRID
jgi:aminocarboxymuconate-semialdehyde decarboxylase